MPNAKDTQRLIVLRAMEELGGQTLDSISIANQALVSRKGITKRLSGLEFQGYVKGRERPGWSAHTDWSLTDKGREFIKQHKEG